MHDYTLVTDTGELIAHTHRADLWTRTFLVGGEDILWPRGHPIIEPQFQASTIHSIESCGLKVLCGSSAGLAQPTGAAVVVPFPLPRVEACGVAAAQPEPKAEGVLVEIEEAKLSEREGVLAALHEHSAIIRGEFAMLRGGVLIHAMVPGYDAYSALEQCLRDTAWVSLTDPPDICGPDIQPWMGWPAKHGLNVWINPPSIDGDSA